MVALTTPHPTSTATAATTASVQKHGGAPEELEVIRISAGMLGGIRSMSFKCRGECWRRRFNATTTVSVQKHGGALEELKIIRFSAGTYVGVNLVDVV